MKRHSPPNIVVIGAGDRWSEQLLSIAETIGQAGGYPVMMDVSASGDPAYIPDYTREDVALAADAALVGGKPGEAVSSRMVRGSILLARRLHQEAQADGIIIFADISGARDVVDDAAALPDGIPAMILCPQDTSCVDVPWRPGILFLAAPASLQPELQDAPGRLMLQACASIVVSATAARDLRAGAVS